MSHSARHPITREGHCCTTCGEPVVYVETEGGSRSRPHWRHKPHDYHWGTKAATLRAALRAIVVTTAEPEVRAIATTALRETR